MVALKDQTLQLRKTHQQIEKYCKIHKKKEWKLAEVCFGL